MPPAPPKPPVPPPLSAPQPSAPKPPSPPSGAAASVPKPPFAPPAPRPAGIPAAPRPSVPPARTPADAGSFGGGIGGLRVSLMPSEIEGKAPPNLRKRVILLALTLVVETLALGIGYFVLLGVARSRTEEGTELAAQRSTLMLAVQKKEGAAKEAVLWNAQRIAAKESLDGHVYWTALFGFLEAKTLPSVRYNSFGGDAANGTITLDARANSYRDVAEQIVVFRNEPAVLDVRTTSASAQVNELGEIVGIAFSMSVRIDPALWLKK